IAADAFVSVPNALASPPKVAAIGVSSISVRWALVARSLIRCAALSSFETKSSKLSAVLPRWDAFSKNLRAEPDTLSADGILCVASASVGGAADARAQVGAAVPR